MNIIYIKIFIFIVWPLNFVEDIFVLIKIFYFKQLNASLCLGVYYRHVPQKTSPWSSENSVPIFS